ncbi:MAG: zinc ribbon domain-containing protein [Chloroflexi bacterium]|nr:zinc ribbon domain-containing protein [Chloroflexota bacterium]
MPQGIQTILQIVLALVGAYLTAFWFCLVVWTFRDIQKRTRDVLVQVLATLLVMVFNVAGLLLYLILRPPETLDEQYARALEEEALIEEIEERQACPTCKQHITNEFQFCPMCGTQLKRVCHDCERLLNLGWKLCPFCGADNTTLPQREPAASGYLGGGQPAYVEQGQTGLIERGQSSR